MYVEKESGTVGSMVGEERGGRCRAQNDRWLLQVTCVLCHINANGPHLPYTHTQHAHVHLYNAIRIVAARKLIKWLHFFFSFLPYNITVRNCIWAKKVH